MRLRWGKRKKTHAAFCCYRLAYARTWAHFYSSVWQISEWLQSQCKMLSNQWWKIILNNFTFFCISLHFIPSLQSAFYTDRLHTRGDRTSLGPGSLVGNRATKIGEQSEPKGYWRGGGGDEAWSETRLWCSLRGGRLSNLGRVYSSHLPRSPTPRVLYYSSACYAGYL